MREVFTSQEFTEVGYYQSILEAAGILTFIRNQNTGMPALSGAMFMPSLCVMNDADFPEALRILKSQQASPTAPSTPDWTCSSCHETNPGNFDLCWNCAQRMM